MDTWSCGINGNELADSWAKQALEKTDILNLYFITGTLFRRSKGPSRDGFMTRADTYLKLIEPDTGEWGIKLYTGIKERGNCICKAASLSHKIDTQRSDDACSA